MSLVRDWSAADAAAKLSRPGRGKAKPNGPNSWMVCCPAHDDRTPSLSLSNGNDGRLLYHCFGGCQGEDVFKALRAHLGSHTTTKPSERKAPKKVIDTFKPIIPVPDDVSPRIEDFYDRSYGAPTKIWTYRDENGDTTGWVTRYDDGEGGKEVVPWLWGRDREHQTEGLRKKGFPVPRPMYQLDKIAAASLDVPICYLEGEKAVDAGQILFPDWVCTTTPGGGNSAHHADFRPLAGRTVIIWADHDGPGYELMLKLQSLRGHNLQRLLMLRFPTHVTPRDGVLVPERYILEEGDDAHDHVARGWTRELLLQAMKTSPHPLTERLDKLEPLFTPEIWRD